VTAPVEIAAEAVSRLLPNATLLETLAELESRLGDDGLDGDARIPVRIEIDRSLASPVGEVLAVRIDDVDPRRPRIVVRAAMPALGGTMATTLDRLREQLSDPDHCAGPVLDLLHHRLVAILYREWRRASGRDASRLDPLRVWARHRLRDETATAPLGVLRSPAISTETLRGVIADRCAPIPVRVREWRERITVLEEGRARIGRGCSRLGRNAMLGPRLVEETTTIEVELGPAERADLEALLEDGPPRRRLRRWIAELLPGGMVALVTVRLPRPGEPTRIGAATAAPRRLGRDAWLSGGTLREARVPAGRIEAGDVEIHRRREIGTEMSEEAR
jgi:predicted component of type VI protein secretion system